MKDDIRRAKFGIYKVTSGPLAEILGIKSSNIADDEARFPPVYKTEGGQRVYNLVEIVHGHIQRIKHNIHAEDSLEGLRKKELVQRELKLRLENEERAGVTMRADTTLALLHEIINSIRGGADALPARVAQQFSGMTRPREIRALLEKELDEVFSLAARAVTDYKKTAVERLRENPEANAAGRPAHSKAPRKNVSRRVGGRKSSPAKRKRGARKVAQ